MDEMNDNEHLCPNTLENLDYCECAECADDFFPDWD
jgi:hypothetical protein